ncbi:MAG: APC family permease [Haloferula sp.]
MAGPSSRPLSCWHAVVLVFSTYTYLKMSDTYPSSGGVALFLRETYSKSSITGASALLIFLVVIQQSLAARTFATYVLQPFGGSPGWWWIPALGVALLLFAFVVNVLGNKFIEGFSFVTAFVKIGGLLVLAGGGLWASGLDFKSVTVAPPETGIASFIGAVALGILAYKGFTTITNSGGEIKEPHKNVGRAIVISMIICVILYMVVAFAVGGNLTISEIVSAKNYSLAEASRPAFGKWGLWTTVGFAIVATVSGVIASIFAVSRMLAMLTEMKLVPHKHFGMPGDLQKHTLVYTVVIAMLLTIFFDLSRIASLGAVFYIVMDIIVHWGVLRHLREEVEAKAWILITAIILDVIVLGAFLWVKWQSDMLVIWASVIGLILVFLGEKMFLRKIARDPDSGLTEGAEE